MITVKTVGIKPKQRPKFKNVYLKVGKLKLYQMKYFIKLSIIFAMIFSIKTAFVETNSVATAEIGGWLGSQAAENQGLGDVGQTIGSYTGGEAGLAVGTVAGQWIGGAIGVIGGPAGGYFGAVVGGYVGGLAGAL